MKKNGIIYEQMLRLIDKTDLKLNGLSFDELLAVLKVEDKRLEKKGYTDVHPSRYELIKTIEKAEEIEKEKED